MILGVAVVAVFVAHGTEDTSRGYGCQGGVVNERFKADLDAYITHWNTTRRQVKLKGLTPAEYRDQALQEAA
ncbi:IS3 family transposase [Pauljensenia sp. UMB3104]|uniref:IS3 family transposase n=1 Tax=Pauljensenia sp. UMB3104 TaxID=3046331 RepID=UPI00254D65C2|nr:IS3 family transposase [Pauljensenia sp. UMB3104]MDK7160192.1 IS3 family transposase [Pauljensenia sp. UMB3104]